MTSIAEVLNLRKVDTLAPICGCESSRIRKVFEDEEFVIHCCECKGLVVTNKKEMYVISLDHAVPAKELSRNLLPKAGV